MMRSASAASYLNVSRRTLMRWCAEHDCPHYKVVNTLLFDEGELDLFIKKHRVEVEPAVKPPIVMT